MKKVLFSALVAVLGLAGTAQAQFSAGTIAVGGGISFSTESSKYEFDNTTVDGDPTVSFSLSPQVGYFLADDLEVGVGIDFNRSSVSGEDDGEDYTEATTVFLFGPYARKYFSLSETIAFFGEGSIAFGGGKSKVEYGSTTLEYNKMSVFAVGVAPGFVFRPAERVGIELTTGFLGYTSVSTEDPDGDNDDLTVKSSDFGLSFDLSTVELGVKLYF